MAVMLAELLTDGGDGVDQGADGLEGARGGGLGDLKHDAAAIGGIAPTADVTGAFETVGEHGGRGRGHPESVCELCGPQWLSPEQMVQRSKVVERQPEFMGEDLTHRARTTHQLAEDRSRVASRGLVGGVALRSVHADTLD